MLTGLPPYYNHNREEMYWNIVNRELVIPNYISKEAASILIGLLQKDPKERIGFKRGMQEIEENAFCQGIDWEVCKRQKPSFYKAPLQTGLKQENFDPEYTRMTPRLSLLNDSPSIPNQSSKPF